MRSSWNYPLVLLLLTQLCCWSFLPTASGDKYPYLCAKEMRKKNSSILLKRMHAFYKDHHNSILRDEHVPCSATNITGMAFAHIQLVFEGGKRNYKESVHLSKRVHQKKYVEAHKAFLLPMYQQLVTKLKDPNGKLMKFQPCSFYEKRSNGKQDGLACMTLKNPKNNKTESKCIWCSNRNLEFYKLTDTDRNATQRLCKMVNGKDGKIHDLDYADVIPKLKKSGSSSLQQGRRFLWIMTPVMLLNTFTRRID